MKKAEESSEELANIIREWIVLEDRTIASAGCCP